MIERHDDDSHANFDLCGGLGESGGQHLGRCDNAIAREKMFGDPNRVESKLFREFELLEIGSKFSGTRLKSGTWLRLKVPHFIAPSFHTTQT